MNSQHLSDSRNDPLGDLIIAISDYLIWICGGIGIGIVLKVLIL